MGQGLTEWLVGRVLEAGRTPDVRSFVIARDAIVDTVSVALAASREPVVGAVGRSSMASSTGNVSVWATGRTASAPAAALANGTAAHALDYDDVAYEIHGHPSAVLVPALVAMAEDAGAEVAAVIDAYCCGYDCWLALAAAIDADEHYATGWHATATLGVLAATAAGARLAGFDEGRTLTAIGLAASTAAGLRVNFGTMTKPLHVGLTAMHAVLAVEFARLGLTSSANALEGHDGYLQLYSSSASPRVDSRLVNNLASYPPTVKTYPCCFQTQRAIDGAHRLSERLRNRGGWASVRSVEVTVAPRGSNVLIHPVPSTGLEAKFSMPYVVTNALDGQPIGFDLFTDVAVQKWRTRQFPEVNVKEAAVPPVGPAEWDEGYAVVRLEYIDGTLDETRVDIPHGDRRQRLSAAELMAKSLDCVSFGSAASAESARPALEEFGASWDQARTVKSVVGSLLKRLACPDTAQPPDGSDPLAATEIDSNGER